jgi:hypothetical protein
MTVAAVATARAFWNLFMVMVLSVVPVVGYFRN